MRRFVPSGRWPLIAGFLCAALTALAEGEPLLPRNPFWPAGYDGKRYPISAEPRFKLNRQRAAAASASANPSDGADALAVVGFGDELTNDPIWADAARTLRFGSTLAYSDKEHAKSAVAINGRIYAVGDLVSINFKGHRLTWRVENLSSEGKITLKRLTYRKIGLNL